MKQTPCEFMKWNGLPVIRREIADSMINNFGLTQKETAIKLGLTPAAICQYISKKRGNIKINDENILREINASAKYIIHHGENSVIKETCRICKLMKTEGIFSFFCNKCKNE
jgi:predicted transcriptional regulator